jgi:hypothetical protein
MRPVSLALAALALLTGVGPAAAQAPPAPPPLKLPTGIRVRVWTRSLPNQRIEGTLLGADSTAVTLVPKGTHPLATGEMRLPAIDVTRLDVALERKSHWWQGALIGAAAGALLVGLSSDVDPVLCEVNTDVLCSRGEAFAYGAGGGALIGVVIGALVKTDQWTPVALDALGPAFPPPVRESRAPLSFRVRFRL